MAYTPLPLDLYLRLLDNATPTNGPFIEFSNAEEVSTAFAEMVQGLIHFVNAARVHPEIGYEVARNNLESLFHMFPLPPKEAPATDGPLSLADLMALLSEIGSVVTDDDLDALDFDEDGNDAA